MENRTDLALESYESSDATELDGVIVRENDNITTVIVTNDKGAEQIGKPIGRYITLRFDSYVDDVELFDSRIYGFSSVLASILPQKCDSVLVAGLGNDSITADSLGPKVNRYIFSTRHIIDDLRHKLNLTDVRPVASITTGVLGETGIETAEIIRGIVSQISPSCVIVVDALAASSCDRLANTIQLSDSGISPGSGVGNHRFEISRSTLGVPVISVGIPTVVNTSFISGNNTDNAYVTPREIDCITEKGAKLIGMGINLCLQSSLELNDLYTLVG